MAGENKTGPLVVCFHRPNGLWVVFDEGKLWVREDNKPDFFDIPSRKTFERFMREKRGRRVRFHTDGCDVRAYLKSGRTTLTPPAS